MIRRRILVAAAALLVATLTLAGNSRTAAAASTPDPGGPYNGVVGEAIAFNGVKSTGAVSWRWDFGDGTTASGIRVTKTYTFPGTYYVVLTTTDEAGVATSALTFVDVFSDGTITTLLPFACPFGYANGFFTCGGRPIFLP